MVQFNIILCPWYFCNRPLDPETGSDAGSIFLVTLLLVDHNVLFYCFVILANVNAYISSSIEGCKWWYSNSNSSICFSFISLIFFLSLSLYLNNLQWEQCVSVTTPSLLYQLLVGLLLKEIFPLMLLFDYIVGIVHVRKKKCLIFYLAVTKIKT